MPVVLPLCFKIQAKMELGIDGAGGQVQGRGTRPPLEEVKQAARSLGSDAAGDHLEVRRD